MGETSTIGQSVWCALCGESTDEMRGAFLGHRIELHVFIDWWGPGVERTFPAPEPLKQYGARWVAEGVVIHQCGTYGTATTEEARPHG